MGDEVVVKNVGRLVGGPSARRVVAVVVVTPTKGRPFRYVAFLEVGGKEETGDGQTPAPVGPGLSPPHSVPPKGVLETRVMQDAALEAVPDGHRPATANVPVGDAVAARHPQGAGAVGDPATDATVGHATDDNGRGAEDTASAAWAFSEDDVAQGVPALNVNIAPDGQGLVDPRTAMSRAPV